MRSYFLLSGKWKTYKEHSVDIVNIAMFPTSVMDVILRHRNLRPIKHRRLNLINSVKASSKERHVEGIPHSYRSKYEYRWCSWSRTIFQEFLRF